MRGVRCYARTERSVHVLVSVRTPSRLGTANGAGRGGTGPTWLVLLLQVVRHRPRLGFQPARAGPSQSRRLDGSRRAGWRARARARALLLRWSRRAAVVCQAGRAEAGQGQPSRRAVQAQQSARAAPAPAVPGAWPGRISLRVAASACERRSFFLFKTPAHGWRSGCCFIEVGWVVTGGRWRTDGDPVPAHGANV